MIQSRAARAVRRRAYEYAMYLTKVRMGYAESRPMRSFPTQYMHAPADDTDCSESAAIVLHAAGAPTPYVVNKQGYTGTMLAKLRHIGKRWTRRGDLGVFVNAENPNGVHVVMFLQGGLFHRDPLVWSHGRPGVDIMPLSQMRRGFPGDGIVYLRSVPLRLRR